jgi:hypothetical protein
MFWPQPGEPRAMQFLGIGEAAFVSNVFLRERYFQEKGC